MTKEVLGGIGDSLNMSVSIPTTAKDKMLARNCNVFVEVDILGGC